MILLCDNDRIIYVIYNDTSSEKTLYDTAVLLICFNQLGSNSDNTLFPKCIRIHASSLLNSCNREKCSPTQFICSEICDHVSGCLFILSYNVLYTCTKSCLDGCFIFLINLDDISNNTYNTLAA